MKLRKFDLKDKKTLLAVAAVCTAFVLLFGGIITAVALISRRKENPHEEAAAAVEHMRGVWIASVSNIDFPSAPDLTKEQLESELDSIVDTADAAGLNAVFSRCAPVRTHCTLPIFSPSAGICQRTANHFTGRVV